MHIGAVKKCILLLEAGFYKAKNSIILILFTLILLQASLISYCQILLLKQTN